MEQIDCILHITGDQTSSANKFGIVDQKLHQCLQQHNKELHTHTHTHYQQLFIYDHPAH
jgi:hypothetical protein